MAIDEMVTDAKETLAMHASPERRCTPTIGIVRTSGVRPPLTVMPTPICGMVEMQFSVGELEAHNPLCSLALQQTRRSYSGMESPSLSGLSSRPD